MFTYLYMVIGVIAYVAMLPVLLLLPFSSKYRYSVPARFFLWRNPPFPKDKIWFHACSLGEVKSLAPIIENLSQKVNVSVITNTGYEAAKTLKAQRRFLPFEIFLPFWIVRQKALVVLEAELWYMLFYTARKKGAKTFLLNARISDRSYLRYKRFKWFYRHIFANVDTVFAQSFKDKERLEELGAQNVIVTGNIKSYQDIKATRNFEKPAHEVVTLASTHEKEEMLLLEHLRFDNRKIVVVPRHPERFDAVAGMLAEFCKARGVSFHRFSEKENFESDLILVDKMGELVNIYAISDVVILGGSFVEGVGGHNPLEPAHFGVKLISGRHIHNQQALFPLVDNVEFCDSSEIEDTITVAEPSSIVSKVDMRPILEELQRVV